MPLHTSRRQPTNADMDNGTIEQDRTLRLAKTNTIISAHALSSSRTRDQLRFSHTLPCKRCADDAPLSSASSTTLYPVEEIRSSSTYQTSPTASKLCTQKFLSAAKYAPIENQRRNAVAFSCSKRCRTQNLHCEDAPSVFVNDIDADKEDKKKLTMWRAACAMAHAYLYQHDRYRGDQREHNQHELSFCIPREDHLVCSVTSYDKCMQVKGPDLQEDSYDLRQAPDHINGALPSSYSQSRHHCPPPPPSKDAPSMCNQSDVVCIDEVVNPTQAAEWFGALFSSNNFTLPHDRHMAIFSQRIQLAGLREPASVKNWPALC